MCIIVAKPAGATLPSKETLISCIERNPHGFGFATPTKVYHTMSPSDFLREVYKQITPDEPAIIHCRIATNGSIGLKNCHPFTDKATGVIFAHNGILHNAPIKGDETDSEAAFRRYYLPVIRQYGYKSHELCAAVRDTIGASRFAFLNTYGQLQLFGRFYEIDGCYYSNLNFDTPYSPFYGAPFTATRTIAPAPSKKAAKKGKKAKGKVVMSATAYKEMTARMAQLSPAERSARQRMYESLFAPEEADLDAELWREQD